MTTFHCPICNLKMFSENEEKEHAKTHSKAKLIIGPDVKKPEAQTIKKEVKMQEIKKEFKMPDFLKGFLHKEISILLFNGSTISGKLTGYSNYDLMLDEKIMVPKHAMLTVQAV
jgi:sRNA-binding regulator protein Hfq